MFCNIDKCYYYKHISSRYKRKCYYGPQCWKGQLDLILVILRLWIRRKSNGVR